jgi:hypothetical protein
MTKNHNLVHYLKITFKNQGLRSRFNVTFQEKYLWIIFNEAI